MAVCGVSRDCVEDVLAVQGSSWDLGALLGSSLLFGGLLKTYGKHLKRFVAIVNCLGALSVYLGGLVVFLGGLQHLPGLCDPAQVMELLMGTDLLHWPIYISTAHWKTSAPR